MITASTRKFARTSRVLTQKIKSAKKQEGINIETGEELLAFLQKEGLIKQNEPEPLQEQPTSKIKAIERRMQKLKGDEEILPAIQKPKPDYSHLDEHDKQLLKSFSTGDNELNNHVLGNIPIKHVDFSRQKNYEMLKIKRPDSKKQVYEQMLDKVRIMYEVAYQPEDFDKIKMYHLNSDQLLVLLKSQNFIQQAQPTRIVDCLKGLQKGARFKLYKERPEIMRAVNLVANNLLEDLSESYFSAFTHAVSKMKIDDEIVWFRIASQISKTHDQMSIRNLSTCIYALTNISKLKPVILNFDSLYKTIEISIVKKFDAGMANGQDIANTMVAYSKSQNGSQQFWQAIESTVINQAHQMSPQELSNVIYSYWKAEHADPKHLNLALKPHVQKILHKMIPVELCQVLMAFTEANDPELMTQDFIDQFETEFGGRFESMNPQDSSVFYFCFTKLGFKGTGMFYRHLQKTVSRTIRAFEGPHLKLMFYRFDAPEQRLNQGVRGRLIEHCRWLMKEKTLKGYDAHNIYLQTQKLPYEQSTRMTNVIDLGPKEDKQFQYHDLHIELRNYLERIRYFN